jgi:hypothetical protein
VPWVAPEQGVSLHRCGDTRCSALKLLHTRKQSHRQAFRTQRHVNKACNICLLMYEIRIVTHGKTSTGV